MLQYIKQTLLLLLGEVDPTGGDLSEEAVATAKAEEEAELAQKEIDDNLLDELLKREDAEDGERQSL
jgi:hypothetical protein